MTAADHAVAEQSAHHHVEAVRRRLHHRSRVFVVALLLLALAAAIAGYFLWRKEVDSNSVAGVPGLKPNQPEIVSLAQLENFAAEQGPIYWAGTRKGTRFEITVTTQGGTYLRYLPDGVNAGARHPYLTVGTYGSINGYGALATAQKRSANIVLSKSGALIATFHSAPDSTYFAFPEADFEVEVYSPVSNQARNLTEAGQVTLIPAAHKG